MSPAFLALVLVAAPAAPTAEADPAHEVCKARSDETCVCIGHATADRILVDRRVEAETGVRPCPEPSAWWHALTALVGLVVGVVLGFL